MVAADRRPPGERCDHTDVAGYFQALAYLFVIVALGAVLATAFWLRPPLIYWPALMAIFVFYVGAMLGMLRHWVGRAVSRAASTTARLTTRPVSRAVVLPGTWFVSAFALLGWGVATVQPMFLGFLSVQVLVFGVLFWRGARSVCRWESQSGSRLLMAVRLGADRSDFLVQTGCDLNGDRAP